MAGDARQADDGRQIVPEDRRRRILALMAGNEQITVNRLAAELGVSKETIRRDLRELAERRLLRKVHGGAVTAQTALESDFSLRVTQQQLEKQRIAECAAAMFDAGDSLFIDAGTTTAIFAGALALRSGLTVITNAIDVASRLWHGPGKNRVHLLGGEYRGDPAECVGPQTIEQIASFRADHAVLTIGAVDAEGGFLDFNMDEAKIAAAMVRQAGTVTVLADHTKLGRLALVKVCDLKEVSRLVTDAPPPKPLGNALHAAGVEVVVA
jgi:DeoR family glycerol-3-phosphate regulon repressor